MDLHPDPHPLVFAKLRKNVPIVVSGIASAVNQIVGVFQQGECCEGWQWLTVRLFHSSNAAGGDPTYHFKEMIARIGLPVKMKTKVPNYFVGDSGQYNCTTGLPLATWLLKQLKICPRPAPPPGQEQGELELLVLTHEAVLAPLLLQALPHTPTFFVVHTGRASEYQEFTDLIQKFVKDLDASVNIDWDQWFVRIKLCYPVKVKGLGNGGTKEKREGVEEESEESESEEESEEEEEEKPKAKAKKTPPKRKKDALESEEVVDDKVEEKPKKTKAADKKGAGAFLDKVEEATGKKGRKK